MKQVVIENPVINSPYVEPTRHFKFTEEGITNEIIEGVRRPSSYFIPIARPRSKGKQAQLKFETEWTEDRLKENDEINRIRERVAAWRKTGQYAGVSKVTGRLLEYWNNPDREKKLFFCQREALETAIYIAEVAGKGGDAWIDNYLREKNEDANPLLLRIAFKMARGSGKTVVMAMLIAWQALNKIANPQDAKFSDTFLIVTLGITIRDRLRVLLPNGGSLEEMDEVACYVKNTNLGFSIPYILNGEEKNYYPDFIVRIKTSSGEGGSEGDGLLNLIVEVTGEHKKDKVAKVSTANTLWIPAINNHGGFGRWAFIEITDPWNAKNEIRGRLRDIETGIKL